MGIKSVKKKLVWIGALAVFAMASGCVYLVVRTILYAFADYGIAEKLIGIALLGAEGFIVIHGLGYALNVHKVFAQKERGLDPDRQSEAAALTGPAGPGVAILVPARNEPREVLESTFITINNTIYRNKTVYFLDDSTQDQYHLEAEELAREYGLRLFRRTKPWHGAKAGIINDCLETIQEEYVAVFDADMNPMPKFFANLIPLMEKDKKLAFVQTPQFYSNLQDRPVALAATLQQAVFYEYICEGKALDDAMFCCGTNVVFRSRALKEVGGFDETSVTEDFATSLRLHLKGWRSLYYGHVSAFGAGPETLRAYFQQQFRWAAGTLGVLKHVWREFWASPGALRPRQWAEYFLSSTYYFIGIAFFVLMMCPVVYLFTGLPTFFARPSVYFLTFLPYMLLSTATFYVALHKRRYALKYLFLGQVLGIIAMTVYVRAALTALLGVKIGFGVTPKNRESAAAYYRFWPQLSLMAINFTAFVWGINRFAYERDPAILVNAFWTAYHFALLFSLFYLNEDHC